MKKFIALLTVLLTFSVFGIEQISVHDLKKVIESNANNFVLIDVRTPLEYESLHIDNAVLVPLQEIEVNIDSIVKNYSDKKIYLICRSGRRSSIAYGILKQFNLSVYNVEGGMNAWNYLSH